MPSSHGAPFEGAIREATMRGLEHALVQSFSQLVLKLTEGQLKAIFLTLVQWVVEREGGEEACARVAVSVAGFGSRLGRCGATPTATRLLFWWGRGASWGLHLRPAPPRPACKCTEPKFAARTEAAALPPMLRQGARPRPTVRSVPVYRRDDVNTSPKLCPVPQ